MTSNKTNENILNNTKEHSTIKQQQINQINRLKTNITQQHIIIPKKQKNTQQTQQITIHHLKYITHNETTHYNTT